MRKIIGEKIKKLRQERGLSISELSSGLNVNGKTLIKWENGAVRMRLIYLIKIAEYFDVSMDFLLGLKD